MEIRRAVPSDSLGITIVNVYTCKTQYTGLLPDELIDLRIREIKKNSASIKKRIEDIIWFYKCGKEEKTSQNNENKREKQIYSYVFDADKIYSAFIQQYNIDLQKTNLHWWQFRSMFESLTDETQIVEIMGYRAMDLSKIKDKEERKRYRKLQKLYALPDMRTQEQKESNFACAYI